MSAPTDFGRRPELTWLPLDRLEVDPAYQRSVDSVGGKRLVAKIAENFRWASFQAILATPTGTERWLIIDGQHRVAAARLAGLSLIPAVVIEATTQAEQAAAFVGANRDRVPLRAQEIYYARLAAGEPEALTLDRLCRAAGITVLRYALSAKQIPAGQTSAVVALLQLVRTHGEVIAGEAIAAVAEIFGRQRAGLRSPFFMAAARFLAAGGDAAVLRRALAYLGIRDLESAGVGLGGHSMVTPMVALIERAVQQVDRPPSAEAAGKIVISVARDPVAPFRSPPPTANERAAASAGRFADDPRARADHGSGVRR